jgi:hypothetical protein
VTLGPRGVNIPDLNAPGLDLFLSLLSERNQIHFKMSKRKPCSFIASQGVGEDWEDSILHKLGMDSIPSNPLLKYPNRTMP